MFRLVLLLLILMVTACGQRSQTEMAKTLRVAVAANFAPTLNKLVDAYSKEHPLRIQPLIASTGMLYAQIEVGAPFDLFFAADAARPDKLVQTGKAHGPAHAYALGKLVLWAPRTGFKPALKRLREGEFNHLAIANPDLAPFGVAASEVLRRLSVVNAVRPKIVRGENVSQVYQYVNSGRADMGFVALSQVLQHEDDLHPEVMWHVPDRMHAPILQKAVVVKGELQEEAKAFLDFCLSKQGRLIIRTAGYDLPEVDFVDY